MPRFAHLADVHLGGWKQPELQDLNFQSFEKAIDICISKKLDFVLIAGDLFDSAYPPIEILKKTFAEFRKLKRAKIPCFIIAGSHDYSVSGKSFLEVLEKAGFCKNVASFNENETSEKRFDKIYLYPTIHENIAIYGYPGKKSGLEVQDLRKIKLNDAPGMFKIFMLHTTLDKAKGTLPIDSIESANLPKADYYALGHLHIDFKYENFIYPGPLFPNNFQELKDLKYGGFYIVDTNSSNSFEKIEIKIKEIIPIIIEINDALSATGKILSEIEKNDIHDKIVLLKLKGEIEKGKKSDINFENIEDFTKSKGAFFILKNTHDLKVKEQELEIEVRESEDIEEEVIDNYSNQNKSDFNELIPQLIHSLSIEKQEGETTESFSNRLVEDAKKILNI